MDIKNIEFDFLAKSLLGQKLDLSKDKISSETVIDACIARADRDMITAGCLYLKSGLKEDRRNIMKRILSENNYTFSRDMITDLADVIDKEKKDDVNIQIAYGLAQKVVNMTYKYLYVFRRYIDKEIDYSICDCPIDSVILSKIERSHINWSQIDENEYLLIQDDIRKKLLYDKTYITEENKLLYKEIGLMLFDFINW